MKTYLTHFISASQDNFDLKEKIEKWINGNKIEGATVTYVEYSNMILIGGYVSKGSKIKKK